MPKGQTSHSDQTPLYSLPILKNPFQCLAMDIDANLEEVHSGSHGLHD